MIAAGQAPDHATIARFRARHRDALAGLFTEILGLCAKAGLVRSGTLALDSTKLYANASGQANMTYEQLAQAILRSRRRRRRLQRRRRSAESSSARYGRLRGEREYRPGTAVTPEAAGPVPNFVADEALK